MLLEDTQVLRHVHCNSFIYYIQKGIDRTMVNMGGSSLIQIRMSHSPPQARIERPINDEENASFSKTTRPPIIVLYKSSLYIIYDNLVTNPS